jgi:hypothetical protein
MNQACDNWCRNYFLKELCFHFDENRHDFYQLSAALPAQLQNSALLAKWQVTGFNHLNQWFNNYVGVKQVFGLGAFFPPNE